MAFQAHLEPGGRVTPGAGCGVVWHLRLCCGEEGINGVLAYASHILHVLPREASPGAVAFLEARVWDTF